MVSFIIGFVGFYLIIQGRIFSKNKMPLFGMAYALLILAAIATRVLDGPVIVQVAFALIAVSLLLMGRFQIKKCAV